MHIDEHQHFPAVHVIVFCRSLLLSLDLDAARLLELPAALIRLGGLQFAAVQSRDAFPIEESASHDTLHHLIEEALHLLAARGS